MLSGFRNKLTFPHLSDEIVLNFRALLGPSCPLSIVGKKLHRTQPSPLRETETRRSGMKGLIKLSLSFCLLAAFASAQNQYIKNVIIVIQENRTPDNLFQALCTGSNCGSGSNQFNLQSSGKCLYKGTEYNVPFQKLPFESCYDPGHNHSDWTSLYDGGGMDGACNDSAACTGGSQYQCPAPFNTLDCTRYSYVDNGSGTIQPYLDLATQYGWANSMYQTSQGPSFPAHQFLLSGTSAPAGVNSPFPKEDTYFAMDNTSTGADDAGCAAMTGSLETLISPTNDTSQQIYPCFEHPTLTDLLDGAGIPWRYYSGVANGIWTAPNAINHICNNSKSGGGGSCGSGSGQNTDWTNDVAPYFETNNALAPFLKDLGGIPNSSCNFQNWTGGVVFVVPDGRWSDHPQKGINYKGQKIGLGADWVANIVNAIGSSNCSGNQPNWSNTVILVVWDDWGGWYDHVNPIATIGGGNPGYPNGTGQQYVYGFRVPLLVISEWVKNDSGTGGHISNVDYDFGSVLKFIESVYGLQEIYPSYDYADHFAGLRDSGGLSDFFCFPPTCQTPPHATFNQIKLYNNSNVCTPDICQSNACDAKCFINYPGSPIDADTY